MALTIVFKDGSTERVDGVADFDIYSGHLVMKDADGQVLGERDDVASAGQLGAAD